MYMSRSTGYDTKGGCSLERRELGRRRPALRNWIMQSFFQPWTRRSVVPLRKRQSSFIIVIVIIIMIRWCSGNPCSVSQPGASSGSPKKTSTATKNKSHAFHLGLKRILPDPSRRSIKKSRHQWRLPQNPWGLEPRESSWWILPETRGSQRPGKCSKTIFETALTVDPRLVSFNLMEWPLFLSFRIITSHLFSRPTQIALSLIAVQNGDFWSLNGTAPQWNSTFAKSHCALMKCMFRDSRNVEIISFR